MTDVAETEQAAVRSDAAARIAELRRVRKVLLPDRDDPLVQSELFVIESQIKAAEGALRGLAKVSEGVLTDA